jgi:DNA-binding response OmpR family regulator
MQGDRENILNSGFDGYLSKPVNARSLAEELQRLLGQREDRNTPPNQPHESHASGKTREAGTGE